MENEMKTTIFLNGNVFDGKSDKPFPGAVVVKNDEVVFTGSDKEARAFENKQSEVIDLEGKTILPGFYEGHAHGIMGGHLMNQCLLSGGKSIEDYKSIIRSYLQKKNKPSHVLGFGWIHGFFESTGPDKKTLDEVAPDIPAVFLSIDYHSCWANSKALEMAGIDKNTKDPHGGHIERYKEKGEPSGCLRESSAIELVMRILPKPSKADWKEAARTYMKLAAQNGIIGIFDAGVLNADQPEVFEAIHEMDKKGELSVRIRQSFVLDPTKTDADVEKIKELRSRYGHGENFKVEVAKIFMDGAVEGHTGFLLESYTDRKGFRSQPVWDADTYEQTCRKLEEDNFQIHVHTIGDGAVRAGLDGIEKAMQKKRDARHTLAHIELADQHDIPRLAKLGMIASFQPAWFYMDENYFEETIPLLAKPRADRRYMLGDFLNAGVKIAFGSDWPWGTVSSSMDPLLAIGTSVTRKDPDDPDSKSYEPQEEIDLPTALKLHTFGGAWQNFNESINGTIEKGKKADLVVLDRNIFETNDDALSKIEVLMTVFEGRVVYKK